MRLLIYIFILISTTVQTGLEYGHTHPDPQRDVNRNAVPDTGPVDRCPNRYAVTQTIVTPREVTTTYQTTIPASTIITTQPASTITTTFVTTYPASTVVTTVVSSVPQGTTTLIATTTVPGGTTTLTTTSVQQAPTVAVTKQKAVPSLCGNQGIQYAAFANNQPAHVDGDVYSLHDPTYMMNRETAGGTWTTLYYNSIYSGIGGLDTSCPNGNSNISIYGAGTSIPCYQFSLNHRFFIYFYVEGVLSIQVSNADDAVIVWYGTFVEHYWEKDYAQLSLAFSYRSGAPGGSFTINVGEGVVHPFRIVHGQATGGAQFFVTAIDPAGNIAMESNTRNSPYLWQYPCDPAMGIPFSDPFGYE